MRILSECMSVGQNKAWDPLELEFQIVVSWKPKVGGVSALKLLSHLSSPNVKSHIMYSLSVKIHYQKTAFPWQAF